MTSFELQAESLTVLPLRLETITIGGPKGTVTQDSWIGQHGANNQLGGSCKLADCDQANVGANLADIGQTRVGGGATLTDVIEDNSRLFQSFPFSS